MPTQLLVYCHTNTQRVCGRGPQNFLTPAIEATIRPFPNPSLRFFLLDFLPRPVGFEFRVGIAPAKQLQVVPSRSQTTHRLLLV